MIQPIILAAGLGTRMGAIKALVPIDGIPALQVVLRTIKTVTLQDPIVVLSLDGSEIRQRVDLSDCTIITNTRPRDGMSQSLRLGLEAVDATATGVLLFHVDMPFVRSQTIRSVLETARAGARLAAPIHNERRGFPVYVAREHLPALIDSLQGDRGGRWFLEQHRDQLSLVAVTDPGCVFDIDRPSDLKAWKGESLCAISE